MNKINITAEAPGIFGIFYNFIKIETVWIRGFQKRGLYPGFSEAGVGSGSLKKLKISSALLKSFFNVVKSKHSHHYE